MASEIFSIELELGPGRHYPYGEFGSRYQLFLPLHADRRLDTSALRRGGSAYRGRRRRAGDGEANGRVTLGPDGRVVLDYDEIRFYPSMLCLGAAPITVGGAVAVAEHDGQVHDYRISSLRQVPGAGGAATSAWS